MCGEVGLVEGAGSTSAAARYESFIRRIPDAVAVQPVTGVGVVLAEKHQAPDT